MSPVYKTGDFLFIQNIFKKSFFQPGKIIVFTHYRYGLLVKEITTINHDLKMFKCRGLNQNSITEDEMGLIPFKSIRGFPFAHFSTTDQDSLNI